MVNAGGFGVKARLECKTILQRAPTFVFLMSLWIIIIIITAKLFVIFQQDCFMIKVWSVVPHPHSFPLRACNAFTKYFISHPSTRVILLYNLLLSLVSLFSRSFIVTTSTVPSVGYSAHDPAQTSVIDQCCCGCRHLTLTHAAPCERKHWEREKPRIVARITSNHFALFQILPWFWLDL